MWQKLGTLIGGVVLLALGGADALLQQKLGIGIDLILLAAGAGALGVHVNLQ